jgi:DnaJ-class molecular chaperone
MAPGPRRGPSPNPQQEPEPEVSTQHDHYATLHVSPDATAREITRAYRTLLRTHHPDIRQRVDDGDTTSATDLQELHAIMQAYVVLSDPRKRAAYDRARRTPGGTGGIPGGTGGTPVKVRFHRSGSTSEYTPGSTPPQREQAPLSFGPARWEPSPRNLRTPRSNP